MTGLASSLLPAMMPEDRYWAALYQWMGAGLEKCATDHDEEESVQVQDWEDVRRCQDGDGEAYRNIVARHQQKIASMMWRFSRDPAVHRELVQDVFVEAYFSLSRYRPKAPFENWLSRIATRVGYGFWRRQAREQAIPKVEVEDWNQVAQQPEDTGSLDEKTELVHQMLAQLPPRDRLVLTYRFVEEYSIEKTAEVTGWSQVMVKVQTLRAKKKLRNLLEQARQEGSL